MFVDVRDVVKDVKFFVDIRNMLKNLDFSRFYQYVEWIVISSLLILVVSQLTIFLNVDVWRQDSMHYVSTYADKLSEEGRWINYLLFNILKVTPSAFSILISYFCLAFFSYSVIQRVVKHWQYSLALALLILTTPVLAVLLEWPDTLFPAFLILAVAVSESKKLPDYIFFPLFSCLFFGTYSAFYFLLPLLFLEKQSWKTFFRLGIIWIVSFLVGYAITNGIVHHLTGGFIQISSWREPHYIKTSQDFFINLKHVNENLINHLKKYRDVVTPGIFNAALIYLLFRCRSLNAWLAVILGLVCALSIYVTAIPLGIIVQERTSLILWVAVLCTLFCQHSSSKGYRTLGFYLMLLFGVKMSIVSYSSISSYSNVTASLVNQIKLAIPYPIEEVDRVYIVVTIEEAEATFKELQHNIDYHNHFSEGISAPLAWVSALKYVGYKNIVLCVNEETGWCAEATAYHKKNPWTHNENGHLFRSYRLDNDVVFTIN